MLAILCSSTTIQYYCTSTTKSMRHYKCTPVCYNYLKATTTKQEQQSSHTLSLAVHTQARGKS